MMLRAAQAPGVVVGSGLLGGECGNQLLSPEAVHGVDSLGSQQAVCESSHDWRTWDTAGIP